MSRRIMIWFYSDMELKREQWEKLFCNSNLAILVQAKDVSIHLGGHNANGVHIQRYNKVGKHD